MKANWLSGIPGLCLPYRSLSGRFRRGRWGREVLGQLLRLRSRGGWSGLRALGLRRRLPELMIMTGLSLCRNGWWRRKVDKIEAGEKAESDSMSTRRSSQALLKVEERTGSSPSLLNHQSRSHARRQAIPRSSLCLSEGGSQEEGGGKARAVPAR